MQNIRILIFFRMLFVKRKQVIKSFGNMLRLAEDISNIHISHIII